MWKRIKAFLFSKNHTVWWGRIQIAIGAIWTVLISTDLSPILDEQTLTYWLIVSGAATEMIRRYKADDV